MNREILLSEHFMQFDKSAKEFCKQTSGLFCDINADYKGVANPSNLTFRYATIHYNSFMIMFTYKQHGALNVVNGILGCSIGFGKNENTLMIPLPLLTDYCEQNIAAPMVIPFISNTVAMKQAFDFIGNIVVDLLDEFSSISYDSMRKEEIIEKYLAEISALFGEVYPENLIIESQNLFTDYFLTRFTSIAFICLLKGNTQAAQKHLIKSKQKTGYEIRLQSILNSQNSHDLTSLSEIVIVANTFHNSGAPKTNFRELFAAFIPIIPMTFLASLIYLGIYFLFVFLESSDSVLLLGPYYNYPLCFLCGFITGIAACYFTRMKMYRLFFPKDFQRYCESESMQGNTSDKIMKVFFTIVTIGCVLACTFFARHNINFLSDGFVDNTTFFSLRGEYYAYKEIKEVYYLPNRKNGFGETLNSPSYVIRLENGKEIDIFDFGEISDYEEKLLPLLRQKNVTINLSDKK